MGWVAARGTATGGRPSRVRRTRSRARRPRSGRWSAARRGKWTSTTPTTRASPTRRGKSSAAKKRRSGRKWWRCEGGGGGGGGGGGVFFVTAFVLPLERAQLLLLQGQHERRHE